MGSDAPGPKTKIHADPSRIPGCPDRYQISDTVCEPTGTLTRAGWQRLYWATQDPGSVTCAKCLRLRSVN